MNTRVKIIVAATLVLVLIMCLVPPQVFSAGRAYQRTGYSFIWDDGTIDLARLGLQFLVLAIVSASTWFLSRKQSS